MKLLHVISHCDGKTQENEAQSEDKPELSQLYTLLDWNLQPLHGFIGGKLTNKAPKHKPNQILRHREVWLCCFPSQNDTRNIRFSFQAVPIWIYPQLSHLMDETRVSSWHILLKARYGFCTILDVLPFQISFIRRESVPWLAHNWKLNSDYWMKKGGNESFAHCATQWSDCRTNREINNGSSPKNTDYEY